MGSFEGALRHLTKSYEYCLLEIYLSVLEVTTLFFFFSCRGNLLMITVTASPGTSFSHIPTYVFEAESAWTASAHRDSCPRVWVLGQVQVRVRVQRKRSICTKRSKRNLHFAPRFDPATLLHRLRLNRHSRRHAARALAPLDRA